MRVPLIVSVSESNDDAIAQLVDAKAASRMLARDHTLWGPDAEDEASKRLGWVDLARTSRPLLAEIDALERVGIDLTDVFLVLEDEGVDKFEKSWTELLETVKGQLDAAK